MRTYKPKDIKRVRQYGVDDLKKYILKLNTNIKVFEEAILNEKKEIEKTKEMIKVLEKDINTPSEIKINQ